MMQSIKKLALFSGKPLVKMHKRLKIEWPIIDKGDRRAVIDAFDKMDFSGRGSEKITQLEQLFSEYHCGMYATAVNSGTAALHLSLLSTGIRAGDEVIVPALTFIATAMSVVHNQSIPIFADIDPRTYNILPSSIEKNISKKTKAIIVVHMHGTPADMDPILKICSKHRLKLIEDVAQSPGAMYKNKRVGTFGDASIFSLMSQKNLPTCGEAGVLLNKNLEGKNHAEMARIYGEVLKPNCERAYNSFTLGWNYTLNPIQAAMAISQFKKYDITMAAIQNKARELNESLKKFKWIIAPEEEKGISGVFHFFRFGLNPKTLGYNDSGRFRQAVQDALNAEGLNVRHYQNTPISGQPFFQQKKISLQLPWSLNKKKYCYDINKVKNTLHVINSTLVLGAISSSPSYLLCPGTIEKYTEGFKKIEDNMELLIEYAKKIKDPEPWKKGAVTSDSYLANYKCELPEHLQNN